LYSGAGGPANSEPQRKIPIVMTVSCFIKADLRVSSVLAYGTLVVPLLGEGRAYIIRMGRNEEECPTP
jgi:hypothetical protein